MQIQIFAPAGLANKRYKMKGGRSFCVCTVIESTITQLYKHYKQLYKHYKQLYKHYKQLYKHYKQQQQKGTTAVATSTATTKAAI
jgi:hypothetical protein